MNPRHLATALSLATLAFTNGETLAAEAMRIPNIVLILADDLGYGDLGCYGNKKVRTPNIDRMAAEGMRFTDFHANGPMCSPTRAALLTGRYQQRVGVTRVGGVLKDGEIVLPSRLREAGYATGMFGKWHISGHNRDEKFYRERLPTRYGFDEFRGLMSGYVDFINHLTHQGRPDWWNGGQFVSEDGYASHLLVDHAIRFIRAHRQRPFFVYLALPDIHFPFMTPEDRPHFEPGVTFNRIGDPATSKLGPHDGSPELQKVVHRMIAELDIGIGRVVETLRNLGLEKNTLVFFTSDNGGYIHYGRTNFHQISDNGPLRGQKGELYEGGHRVPAIAWRPGVIRAGTVTDVTAMTFDLFPTFLQLAGLEEPPAASPNALDGISLLPLLHRQQPLPSRQLFWEHGGLAMRDGDWKLLRARGNAPPELYFLKDDLGETTNLAEKHPEIVDRMDKALRHFAASTAVPKPPI